MTAEHTTSISRRLLLTLGGFFIALSLVLPTSEAFAQSSVKLAYVHMADAVSRVNETKKARKVMEASIQTSEKKLSNYEKAIKARQKELKEKQVIMTPEDIAKENALIEAEIRDYQHERLMASQRLSLMEAELVEEIMGRLRVVIADIAKERGYTAVLTESGAAFVQPRLDITAEVVKRYNAKHP